MLTPPGLKGKQYRITGTAYPRLSRPHRRRRHVLLALVGVLTLAVLGWGTVQLFGVFGPKKAGATAGCKRSVTANAGDAAHPSATPSAGASAASAATSALPAAVSAGGVPKPSAITVNVYNATNRSGLAGQTAALLKQRGFLIGKIGNAPAALQNKLAASAQVTGGSTSGALMTVLGSEVAGAKPVVDARKDASVDLVLGNGFTALSTPAQAAQALAQATTPTPAPSSANHC
ncbi:LytR C-terminal domain-containing protein [Streptacidiphilus sp. EB129]|uniref:LytR C-terminal domain-containing protein n=1 Tax=Streptacidiphilus sp. EB129 TaxID=3156262 RepID=UPI0035190483